MSEIAATALPVVLVALVIGSLFLVTRRARAAGHPRSGMITGLSIGLGLLLLLVLVRLAVSALG